MPTPTQITAKPSSRQTSVVRRIWITLIVFLILLALALIPPYLNVNRLQRRITASISASLGRPVHLDNVTLILLPIPSFTLDNFVVSEDPAFGYEPTIRANTVTARLRVSTLWHRRIEISRITFTDPSVNIVHTADGKWNLDSILLQASRVTTAPTAQRDRGPAPRFPYIEASGARLNLKLDQVKTPFSLTEADFALWLPSPETWHFRITARPARTDVPVNYSGLLHLEGTLGRAPTLAQIPIDLHGEWRAAPLGEVSRILLGRDAGWRGDLTLTAATQGTVGSNTLHAAIRLADLHRNDFVPVQTVNLAAECEAAVANAFTTLAKLQCIAPSASNSPAITLTGSLAPLHHPEPTSLHAQLNPTPAATLVPILQTFSQRIPPNLALGGTLSGDLSCNAAPCDLSHLQGSLLVENASILPDANEESPILLGDFTLDTLDQPATPDKQTPRRPSRSIPAKTGQPAPVPTLLLSPTEIALGGRDPALLEGRIDLDGITLHLAGNATPERLHVLTAALPQLADGLPPLPPAQKPTTPIHLDLTTTHPWGAPQIWQETTQKPNPSPPSTKRRGPTR